MKLRDFYCECSRSLFLYLLQNKCIPGIFLYLICEYVIKEREVEMMFLQVIILLAGFLFLVKGADWFVEGAASIAKSWEFHS